MGSIEKRGENSWRVGFRLPANQGRAWIRRSVTFPSTMSEEEQRKACEVELARLVVDHADGRIGQDGADQTSADLQQLIDKYHISPRDAALLQRIAPADPSWVNCTITVRQLYDKWMDLHCIPNLKHTTVKTYQNLMATHVLPMIGDRRISTLTALDIDQLMAHIRATGKRTTAVQPEMRKRKQDRNRPLPQPKPLSDRSVQHIYDTTSHMFDAGVRWELIPSNPMAKAIRPTARRRRLVVLDDEQAVELLRRLAKEESLSFRCAVMLALVCGLRLSEVCALSWADVNWKRCTITISRGLNYAPGFGNYLDTTKSSEGERELELPAGMMTLLQETKAWQDDIARQIGDRWRGEGRIVCGWDGAPQHHDTPSKQFRNFAKKNGFGNVRFHDLRHSHATLLFANNLDAVAVAHRLGHASPETTFRFYAHAIRSRDAASAAAMQHYIDAASDAHGTPDATPIPSDTTPTG